MKAAVAELPKISLREALASRFVYQGEAFTVGRCPAPVLKAFVLSCIEASGKSPADKPFVDVFTILAEEDSDLTRWYLIEALLNEKVRLPLVHNS